MCLSGYCQRCSVSKSVHSSDSLEESGQADREHSSFHCLENKVNNHDSGYDKPHLPLTALFDTALGYLEAKFLVNGAMDWIPCNAGV